MDSSASSSSELHSGGVVLVEARLQGGAPWGFTLQGGLEHGEPLIISKVEEGGKVCCLQHPLLAGDKLLLINQVELSGFRQEAVSLVKGSHRTLQLTVCREREALSTLGNCDSHFSAPPPEHTDQAPTRGVQLCINNRRSEPPSRPHSWHSTKLGGGGPHASQLEELSPGGLDTLHTPWHHGHQHHHASVSTTDLCVGWDSEFSYLRRSPDQYSSRESLDSLDPPPPSQSRAGPLDPPLDPHDHRDHQQTPAHSSTRSSNSMDLLHNKRDSAYSSFSTSSSIPEYLASAPSLSSERCYSLESVPQRGREGEGCYSLESVSQRGREGESPHGHAFMRSELTSATSLGNSLSQERGVLKQGPGGFYRGSSSSGGSGGVHGSKRHSVGPIWGLSAGPSSSDSLKEAPAPPHRSDSYTATRTHERPNSWSSLDHARSLRSLHKGSWHHSSGSVASAKGSYTADVQLHTVVEKSPESSPTTRPRQGGGCPPPGPSSEAPHTGAALLGAHPLPCSQGPGLGHPASGPRDALHQLQPGMAARNGGEEELKGWRAGENGYQSSLGPLRNELREAERAEDHQHQLSPRVAQGQVASASPPKSTSPHPLPHPQPTSQAWDQAQQEHPLTRLEMALAEVQRCAIPDSILTTGRSQGGGNQANSGGNQANSGGNQANNGGTQANSGGNQANNGGTQANSGGNQANNGGTQANSGGLSVLEKVSRFERRQHSVKQRSLSSRSYSLQYKNDPRQSGKSSPCGAEDLRNMLERSGAKAHRTMSYRGGSSDYTQHRSPADPSSVLLRSYSTFHLRDPRPEDTQQHLLCAPGQPAEHLPFPDHSFSSSYRDSLKDAQSKVLGSTSFRRRDLSSSLQPPPPAPLLHHHSSSSFSPGLPSTASQLSLEKRGPKTYPKPHRVVLTASSSSSAPSPHTPRERHTVGPLALPSLPAVGPPLLGRVCGRRRLSVQQKKRSFSEPESLHEVGVSDPETSALFRRGPGESSVADRRRMFELPAHSGSLGGDGPRAQVPMARPQSAGSRPPALRQAQQDALAQYMQRKRTEMRDPERPPRPHSYLQPESDRRIEASSLSSTSSLLSLQESIPDWTFLTGEGWLSSPSPPGAQSSMSAERPPSSGTEPASPARHPHGLPPDQGLSRQVHGALQRARSSTLASAEDLLQEREMGGQLHCCFSTSPNTTSHHQDVRDVTLATLPTAEGPQQSDRTMNTQTPEGYALSSDPAHHHYQFDVSSDLSVVAAPQAGARESHPPVTRRERPHISSPLAASVGLACLPPLHRPTSSAPRPTSPLLPPTPPRPHPVTSPPSLLNSVEDGVSEEAAGMNDSDRVNHFALPLPSSLPSTQHRLSSLRISESSLLSLSQPSEVCQSEDLDEVFLAFPAPLPITESDILEHSPPPPPPQQEVGGGTGIHGDNPFTMETTASVSPSPHPVPWSVPGGFTSLAGQDNLELKYQPLPKREAPVQELRAQALLGQLVLRDRSLAPVLDTLGSKRTIELMEDVFHGTGLADKSPWQCRDASRWEDHRLQAEGCPGAVSSLETNLDDEQKDLNVIKVELCEALGRCVEALREEKEVLQEELRQHRALAADLEAVVQDRCRPNEREKYRVFIGDLEKVVNLLLSLSGRLARTEAALYYLEDRQEDCIEERASLLLKRSQLLSQREDARELKENLERRQRIVHALLSSHMTPAQLLLYRQLVTTKPSLLIRQRRLDDLIRQGEEHTVLIKETLPPQLTGELETSRGYQLSSSPAPLSLSATPQGYAQTARCTAVTSL